jgi:hypothetical protein
MEHLVKSGIAHHNKDYNCAVRILLWFWLRQVRGCERKTGISVLATSR